jgi:hypothetical protein
MKRPNDWPTQAKTFLFNLFMIALLVIAILKVLRVEFHDLLK